jgi:hypothetical protein
MEERIFDVQIKRPFLPTAWAATVGFSTGYTDRRKNIPAEEGFGRLVGTATLFSLPALFLLGSLVGAARKPIQGASLLENTLATGVKATGVIASLLIPPTAVGYALGRLLAPDKKKEQKLRKQANDIWEKGAIATLLTGIAAAAAQIEKRRNPDASIPQAYWNIYKYVAPVSTLVGGVAGYKLWQGSPKATLLGALSGLLVGGIVSGTALPLYYT